MLDEIAEACGVSVSDKRYVIVGCETVPGFEAVALGEKVNTAKVQPGIVALAKKTIADHPSAHPRHDCVSHSAVPCTFPSLLFVAYFLCSVCHFELLQCPQELDCTLPAALTMCTTLANQALQAQSTLGCSTPLFSRCIQLCYQGTHW